MFARFPAHVEGRLVSGVIGGDNDGIDCDVSFSDLQRAEGEEEVRVGDEVLFLELVAFSLAFCVTSLSDERCGVDLVKLELF
jgi:hypothetical protein